jgi:hypothetical protein
MTPWAAPSGRTIHRGVVRRASLLAVLVVTALSVQAESAVAATGFSDPFDSLDGGRWSAGDHQLRRSSLDLANVAVAGGALELCHPAGSLDGAEVRTNAHYRTGIYRAASARRPRRPR